MNIEIWSDVVCPWCYIGKRRFEKALAEFAHRDAVTVTWRSYQLDPHAAPGGDESVNEMLARRKGISAAQAAQMNAHVSRVAAEDGLEYHLDKARWGNTYDAHRIIHLAAKHGLQAEAEERLFRAYFTEARPIGDRATLVELAAEIGLDADEARAMLESDAMAHAFEADIRRGASFGIQGVPFFVIDERYGISGAQSPEIILDTLEKAWRESHPLESIVTGDGGTCDDGACDVPPAG